MKAAMKAMKVMKAMKAMKAAKAKKARKAAAKLVPEIDAEIDAHFDNNEEEIVGK